MLVNASKNNQKNYVKSYDGLSKWIYFLNKDDVLLEEYDAIWEEVKADRNSEPVYNKKIIKTKIKSHDDVTDNRFL